MTRAKTRHKNVSRVFPEVLLLQAIREMQFQSTVGCVVFPKHRSYLHTATLWEANDVWMSFTHMESARFSWNNSLCRPTSTWTSQVMWKFEALLGDPNVRSHLPMD